jgi:hypothetical protein
MNLEEINERFKSGNSVPVERAHLKADEWALIYSILKDLAYPTQTAADSRRVPRESAFRF